MSELDMYETKISDIRWILYDIPGNIGWIAYFTGIILTFINMPDFMSDWIMAAIMLVSIIPAIMMLIGIIELINERINKFDRVLTKKRLYRGFGMLFYGGIAGAVISVIEVIDGITVTDDRLTYYLIMLCGAILCAVFGGLLFKGYQSQTH